MSWFRGGGALEHWARERVHLVHWFDAEQSGLGAPWVVQAG